MLFAFLVLIRGEAAFRPTAQEVWNLTYKLNEEIWIRGVDA
jgi:hypothetical protein